MKKGVKTQARTDKRQEAHVSPAFAAVRLSAAGTRLVRQRVIVFSVIDVHDVKAAFDAFHARTVFDDARRRHLVGSAPAFGQLSRCRALLALASLAPLAYNTIVACCLFILRADRLDERRRLPIDDA